MALAGPSTQKMSPREIGTSTLPHETNRSSDALKDPPIRRAVSTLVYATPLHPAQTYVPMTNAASKYELGVAPQIPRVAVVSLKLTSRSKG